MGSALIWNPKTLAIIGLNTSFKNQNEAFKRAQAIEITLPKNFETPQYKMKPGLTVEHGFGARAQRVNDVDDEAVHGGAHAERPGADEERDDVEEVRQVARHVERVVERQHEQVARQNRDVVPHHVLLQRIGRRLTSLVYHLA